MKEIILIKITKNIPGIIVKRPAADNIVMLDTKTLATRVIIALIGLASITVKAFASKTSVQENKKQKKAVTPIPGAI